MRRSFSLLKTASFMLLIDPLFYISSIITILFCSFRFFFAQKFFVSGIGTTDLRALFQSVPYVSIVTVPLLVFRLRPLIFDDSVPFSPIRKFSSVLLSSFFAFAVPLLFLISVPVCVSSFGDVDAGQVASGFFGVLLYGLCALSLVIFLFAAIDFSPSIPLLVSILILAAVDFIHLVPLYLQIGSFLTFILQKISFAWHFDSFGKGIVDSRNLIFYAFSSVIFILLSVFAECRRTGKKISPVTVSLFAVIFLFSSLAFDRIYFRSDFTKTKRFSVSETSKSLVAKLSSPLRLTYYRSKELKELYPQSSDVSEYLQDFAEISSNVTFSLEKPDVEKLSRMKIQGQQIQSNSETRMEFVTVYSAVVIQYLEKQTIIPFVLSTSTLEYDLAQRIQQLVTENYRKVLVVEGNGRDVAESYSYVVPHLASRGFMPEIAHADDSLVEKINELSEKDELLVLGSSALTYGQANALREAFDRNVPAFVATSPYNVPVETEWQITKNKNDALLPILNSRGFAFGRNLVEDLSCFPVSMQSGEGSTAEYVTVNYPLWLSILPQEAAKQGMTVFWASPILLYGNTNPLITTTKYAWLQNESESEQLPFLTDPFSIPKSAGASDAENGQYVVAATDGKITVLSDQYSTLSLMTGFISSDVAVDFRNYDFMCSQLLRLRGDGEIADLMEKTRVSNTLYKITDSEEFMDERFRTIALNFVVLPSFFVAAFVIIFVKRRRRTEK
ncbi:MAG: GldG family protein [Treponema sp.]|nr:GldG family protein [Treponema sp.]